MKRALPPSAIAYARSRLWQARDLEQPLMQVLDGGEFKGWTLAREEIPDTRLETYDTGGLTRSGDVAAEVAEQAVRIMQRVTEATWVVPDSLARPGDPLDIDHVVLGDAIYYVVERPEEPQVRKAWRQAASAAGQLALVSYCRFPPDPTPESLGLLAETAQLVALTAYDGEGAIYLERHETHV